MGQTLEVFDGAVWIEQIKSKALALYNEFEWELYQGGVRFPDIDAKRVASKSVVIDNPLLNRRLNGQLDRLAEEYGPRVIFEKGYRKAVGQQAALMVIADGKMRHVTGIETYALKRPYTCLMGNLRGDGTFCGASSTGPLVSGIKVGSDMPLFFMETYDLEDGMQKIDLASIGGSMSVLFKNFYKEDIVVRL